MGNQNTSAQDKKKTIIITLCVILAAALVIGLTVFNSMQNNGTVLRSKTAASSENFKVTGTMMAYFFNSNYQSYSQYLSYLGVQSGVSLKSQECAVMPGTSWFDYFASMTKESVTELLALCEAAKAAGVELDADDRASIDANMDSLEEAAKMYGYSLKQFLIASIGSGVNEKDVKKCLELSALASKYSTQYSDGLNYTDDELDAYYTANPASFDGVDYYSFNVNATDFMEKDPSGNPVGETASASASAEEAAKKLAAATSADEFKSLVREYAEAHYDADQVDEVVDNSFTYHALASQIASVSDWAFSAKAGDTKMEGESGATTFTVYYLDKPSYRDETKTRSVRHVLFTTDTYADDSKVNEVYAEWEAAGFSEDKIIELANEYTEDTGSAGNGGLYQDVARGETVNTFNAWLFDSARKPGDHGIVESQYGWHIMYYVGEGENPAWKMNAIAGKKSEDYAALVEGYAASQTFSDDVIAEINA